MGALKSWLAAIAVVLATAPAGAATHEKTQPAHTMAGNFLIAEAAEHAGDWDLAGRLLARSWRQGRDPDVLREGFLISLGAGNLEEALSLSSEIQPGMAESGIAGALQAAAAIRRNDVPAARKIVSRLAGKGVGAPLKVMLGAWLDAATGKKTASLTALAEMKGYESYRQLHTALIQEFTGDGPAADQAYAALAEGTPMPRIASIAADYYRRTNRPELAVQTLGRVNVKLGGIAATSVAMTTGTPRARPTLISGAAETFYNVSELLLEADHPDVALFYAEIARYIDPGKPDAHLLLGEIEQAEGRYEQAATDFMAVPEKSDFGLLARMQAVLAVEQSGSIEAALAEAEQLVKDRPQLPGPIMELGDMQRRHGRLAQSIVSYGRALPLLEKDDIRRGTVLFARGIAHDQLHEDTAAEDDLGQAAVLSPDRPVILNYLGYFWASRNRKLDQAQAMLEHAWTLAPTDGAIADSLGWTLYQRGDYAGAVAKLEDAVRLMPGDSEINGHLGDAYWQLGRRIDARFQWRHALLNAPSASAPSLRTKLNEGLAQTPQPRPQGENHAEMETK